MLKQYIAQLMNKENEWNQDTLREIKEVLADCIKVGEVTKALEKMIKHNATGLSVVVTEMLQAAGETGVDWLTQGAPSFSTSIFHDRKMKIHDLLAQHIYFQVNDIRLMNA